MGYCFCLLLCCVGFFCVVLYCKLLNIYTGRYRNLIIIMWLRLIQTNKVISLELSLQQASFHKENNLSMSGSAFYSCKYNFRAKSVFTYCTFVKCLLFIMEVGGTKEGLIECHHTKGSGLAFLFYKQIIGEKSGLETVVSTVVLVIRLKKSSLWGSSHQGKLLNWTWCGFSEKLHKFRRYKYCQGM